MLVAFVRGATASQRRADIPVCLIRSVLVVVVALSIVLGLVGTYTHHLP